MCATLKRHRFRSGHFDINGFISQLLESSKFDELAEKLAEKAANKIMHMKEDQRPVGRANDANEVQNNNTESTTQNSPTNLEEKQVKKHQKSSAHLRKGFAGKVNPQAVMNETISLSENIMLRYKLIKKNALEIRNKKQRDEVPKNITNEDRKDNKTAGPVENGKNKKGGQPSNQNATQHNKDDIKNELVDENKSLREDTKDDNQKEEPKRNTERNRFQSETEGERNEKDEKNDHPPKEPSREQDDKNFRVEQNSGAEVKGQEASRLDNGIKEEIPSSLDEQNRNYSPSEEIVNAEAEVEGTEDEPRKRGTEESIELGHPRPYFRGREGSVEENIVPSRSDKTNAYGGIDISVGSNESGANGDRGSYERSPDDKSREADEDPAKPVIRREGDKVYIYNQAPEYQDYHEEMAKLRKEHPENPADFL